MKKQWLPTASSKSQSIAQIGIDRDVILCLGPETKGFFKPAPSPINVDLELKNLDFSGLFIGSEDIAGIIACGTGVVGENLLKIGG